jgi:uncharacterized membrane protein YwzB
MLIVVIITGIVMGWVVGNFILDKWVNESNEDINNEVK